MLGYALRGIAAALTVAYLLTAASACREEEQAYTPAEVPVAEEAVRELSVLSALADASLPLQQAAEEFGGEYRITVETVAEPSAYRTALMARLVSGEDVGLFQLYGWLDARELEPSLGDLGFLPWASESLVEPLRAGSRLVGIPYAVRGSGFLVNREIFEAAGLPFREITGYESWRDSFAALQATIDGGELAEAYPDLMAVTTIPAQSDEYLGRYLADLLLSGAFSSPEEVLSAPSLALTGAEDCESFLRVMIGASPFRQDWGGLAEVTTTEMIENGLAAERVAAILCDTDNGRRIYARNPELDLMLLLVCLEDREEGAVFVDSPAYWAMGAAADEGARELAGEFLTWLYQEPEGTAFFAERFGAASPYRDKAADTGVDLHKQLYDRIDDGLAVPALHSAAPLDWREDVLAKELREYLTVYDKSWEDAILGIRE